MDQHVSTVGHDTPGYVGSNLCGSLGRGLGLLLVGLLLRQLHRTGRALGLGEVAGVDAGPDAPVEVRVEGARGRVADVVVREHVFLDGLTTRGEGNISARSDMVPGAMDTYLLPLRSLS